MIRGEVWWTDVPGAGRRPCVVLTRDTAIPFLPSVVVAHITTAVRGTPSEVPLDHEDGLPERCAITLDNLHTVPKRLLRRLITRLSDAKLQEVCDSLSFAVGC